MIVNSGGQLFPVLLALVGVLQLGFLLSAIGLISHALTCWLSQYTRIEEPDPTVYLRPFESIFNTLFAPIGEAAATKTRSAVVTQVSFQLSIGVAVIVAAVFSYLSVGSVIVGATVAANYSFGVAVDPLPLFRWVVAFVVLCALAIMFHAGEKAKQIPA